MVAQRGAEEADPLQARMPKHDPRTVPRILLVAGSHMPPVIPYPYGPSQGGAWIWENLKFMLW
jgi:hypothetical protein